MRKIEKNIGLGQRIKSIRLRLGKNQSEFGEMFDPPAPKGAVSRWEHGGGPNKQRLKKIAELGGVSVEYLVNGNRLSLADTKILFDKAVHKSKLSKDERQKLVESQLDVASAVSAMVSRWDTEARNQVEKQQTIIESNPLSGIELQAYGDFLNLFNLIRLHGSEKQQTEFDVLINMLRQIASGSIKYDKDDLLPNIDKFLASLPVKKDNKKS